MLTESLYLQNHLHLFKYTMLSFAFSCYNEGFISSKSGLLIDQLKFQISIMRNMEGEAELFKHNLIIKRIQQKSLF